MKGKKGLSAAAISIVVIILLVVGVGSGSKSNYVAEKKTEHAYETYEQTQTISLDETTTQQQTAANEADYVSVDSKSDINIPDYSGNKVEIINNDVPFFSEEEKVYSGTYIYLSELDYLGRCGLASACVGLETRTYEDRGSISNIYPTGWKQLQLSSGSYLYNRSHLLMYALTGINTDKRNLITGTRQFNASTSFGMLAYENQVLWVVDNYNAHVLYRVTPYFDGDNLLAKGVLIEAYCIEYPDECEFCVFVYNVQDGVEIDYATGEAHEIITDSPEQAESNAAMQQSSVNNTEVVSVDTQNGDVMVWIPVHGGTKYHNKQNCSNMKDPIQVSLEEAQANGYEPCKKCYR